MLYSERQLIGMVAVLQSWLTSLPLFSESFVSTLCLKSTTTSGVIREFHLSDFGPFRSTTLTSTKVVFCPPRKSWSFRPLLGRVDSLGVRIAVPIRDSPPC